MKSNFIAIFLGFIVFLLQIPSLLIAQTLVSPNEEDNGRFGLTVAGIGGDVNGDGKVDVIVGAFKEGPGAFTDAGRAYIYSGADGSVLDTLVSGNEEGFGNFGIAVAGIGGDVNADGTFDIIVGAPNEDPGASPGGCGRAYIISGADGSVLSTLVSPSEEASGNFGWSVSGIGGDVNGDGKPDVVVGARKEDPGSSPTDAGRAYIFSGADGSLLDTLISPQEETSGFFGYAVAGVGGDVNADGKPDVMVGAYNEDPGSSPDAAGRVYIFSGADGSILDTLVSPNEETNGNFGWSITGAGGDLNADGKPDVVVGAPNEAPGGSPTSAGRVYIFSGADGSIMDTLTSPNEVGGGDFGYAVACVGGDIDGDSKVDLIIGAPFESHGASPSSAGRVYIISGANGSVIDSLKSANEELSGQFGSAVAGIQGDIDADSKLDFIVGAFSEDPGASPNTAGRAYMFSGATGNIIPVELLSFTVFPQGLDAVQTQWSTATELNSDYYEIQRSTDLRVWEFVDIVDAAGNSSTLHEYQIMDHHPYRGTSYYRLLQVDNDGEYKVFGPVATRLMGVEVVNLWPNPVVDRLTFELVTAEEGVVKVMVVDKLGSIVKIVNHNTSVGTNTIQLNFDKFAVGEYILKVETSQQESNQRVFTVGE